MTAIATVEKTYHRRGHCLTVCGSDGRSQQLEIPLRAGCFEHLSDVELYELAVFFRLHGIRSRETLKSYISHLERFLFWMRINNRTVIDELTLTDYQQALINPPATLSKNSAGITFNRLTESTADQYMAPVRSFCTHLSKKGLLVYNPASFVKRMAVNNYHALKLSKAFDKEQWQAIQDTLNNLPEDSPGQINRKERLQFCIRFGYAMGLRINESITHSHANIRQVKGDWCLDVIGKGRRARRLKLNDSLIDDIALCSLQKYRKHLGLPEFPQGERVPLLPPRRPVSWSGRGASRHFTINEKSVADSTWQGLFKDFLRVDVMNYLYDDNSVSEHIFSEEWQHFTPHSLRHTRITHLVNTGKDLLWVQRFAGHEKLDTTANYYHG